jgi:hypothetical protein
MGALPVSATTVHQPYKVYVCKYVGTPGVNEQLKRGRNPIRVSATAIAGDPVYPANVVGITFNDAQTHSIAIGWVGTKDVPLPKKTRADCPPITPPNDPPPSTQPSSAPPSEAPSSAPPSEAPSSEPPSEAPSSAPPSEEPSISVPPSLPPGDITAFAAPCPFDELSDTQAEVTFPSRLRFVGLLLLMHVFIDGQEVVPDENGEVTVTPGLRHVQVLAPDGETVLLEGDVFCPTCTLTTLDTPPPGVNTLPPTDVIASQESGQAVPALPIVLMLLGVVGLAALSVAPKRR